MQPVNLLRDLLCGSIVLSFASVSIAAPWFTPIHAYLSVQEALPQASSQPIVTDDVGNPLTTTFDNQNLVVSIDASSLPNSTVGLELSLDGVNWFTATLIDGRYEYDFGLLAEGSYQLQLRSGQTAFDPIEISVAEYVAPPERVVSGMAPDEVGAEQPFTMSWSASAGADYYNVLLQRGDSQETLLQKVENITATSTTLSHSQVEVILVRVEACNFAGCATPGGTRIVNVLANVPDRVSEISVPQPVYLEQPFAVSWNTVANATSYKVRLNGVLQDTTNQTQTSLTSEQLGNAAITITACNNNGCSAPSDNVNVNVALHPDAPHAEDDTASVPLLGSSAIQVLANDSNPTASSFSIHKILSPSRFGSVSFNTDKTQLIYAHTNNQCQGTQDLEDSVTYNLINNQGHVSNSATLTVRIQCAPEGLWIPLPTPVELSVTGYELRVGLLDFYLVPKISAQNMTLVGKLPIALWTNEQFIRLFKNSNGDWTSELVMPGQALGNLYSGAIKNGIESISTINGNENHYARLNFDLDAAPQAVNDNLNYIEGIATQLGLTANDAAPSPLNLRITAIDTAPQFGTAAIVNDGRHIRYTPTAGNCEDDGFTYTVTNNNQHTSTASVTLSCTPLSEVIPQPVDDEFIVRVDIPNTVDVIANDIDPSGAGLTLTSVSQPTVGTAIIQNNRVQYQADECVAQTLSYTVANQYGSADAQLMLQCALPVANDDSANVLKATQVTIDVLANDQGAGGNPLSLLAIRQAPTFGTAQIIDNQVVYTHTSDVCGSDSFEYQMTNDYDNAEGVVTVTCFESTHWTASSITVGQSATINWFEPGATYCSASHADETVEGEQGTHTYTFYQPGEFYWQCFDPSGAPIGEPVSIIVNKLAAPALRRQ